MSLRNPPVTSWKDEENSAFTEVMRSELMREELTPHTTQDHFPPLVPSTSASAAAAVVVAAVSNRLPRPTHSPTPAFSQVCESLSFWPRASLTSRILSQQLLRKLTLEDCFDQRQKSTDPCLPSLLSIQIILLVYLWHLEAVFFAFVSKR